MRELFGPNVGRHEVWLLDVDRVRVAAMRLLHTTALVSAGQTYVTGLINAIMQGPDWNSSAIFLSWDDWGGFYDHAAFWMANVSIRPRMDAPIRGPPCGTSPCSVT